jgi:hypothetical protein
MKKIVISISLFLFVSSSLVVTAEPEAIFDYDVQTSFWMDDEDSSADANRTRRISKRSPRGKSPLKSLSSLSSPPRAINLTDFLRETYLVPGFSKASVYQQINVYRI